MFTLLWCKLSCYRKPLVVELIHCYLKRMSFNWAKTDTIVFIDLKPIAAEQADTTVKTFVYYTFL